MKNNREAALAQLQLRNDRERKQRDIELLARDNELKGAALARTLKALQSRGLIAAAPVEGRAKRSKWADPAASACRDRSTSHRQGLA